MVTLDDIRTMTQEQFDALSEEDKRELARELAYRVVYETPVDKQRIIFTAVECYEMFGEEFGAELFATKDRQTQKRLVWEWGARLKYLKSVLDIGTVFDRLLEGDRDPDEYE